MSNAPPSSDPSKDDAVSRTTPSLPVSPERATALVRGPIRAVAFWCATLLPLVYVPLLAFGLDTRRRASAFVVLLVVHVVALFLGRSYRSE